MNRITHRVFGTLEKLSEIPDVNMHWWRGSLIFPPIAARVALELHAVPTGPNDIQVYSYEKLLQNYSMLRERGTENGDVPSDSDDCHLTKITFFVNGHLDLHFNSGGEECLIYADADAAYMTPSEAMEC